MDRTSVIQCNIRDISERKQAKIDIRKKSEQLLLLSTELEIIMDNIPALVFYKDINNRFIRVNKYMCDAYKMSKKQLEGASLFDLHSSEEAQAYYDDDLQVIQSRQPKLNIDEPWETENGTQWINTSKIPRINETGEVVGVIGISMDITERKRVEQILRENEQRLSSIYDIVGDVIYYLKVEPDEQYRFSSVNPSFLKVTGLPAEQVIGMKVSEIIPEPSLSIVLGKYRQAIQEKCIVRWEETSDYPTGRLIGDVSIAPVFDEAGNCTHLVGSVHDITERKKAEGELVLANKELAFQNEEKEKRAAELAIANKELHFQNEEKEKRAAELAVANKELLFQNEEKEKRAAELVLANEETVSHLQNIQALHKIDQAIAGSLDLNLTLNVVLEQVKTQLNIDAAAVLLLNPHTQILEFTSGLGFRSKAIERSRVRLGEGHSGRAALERRTVSVTDLLENSTQFVRAPLLAEEGFVTYFGTPLIAKGQVNGVLEVFHRSPFAPDENWLEFFKILAGQAAIAVDNASLFTDLIHSNAELFAAYDSTIEGWSHALDLRDKETEGHTQRVTEMALKLARAAGITEEELVHVRHGALLHDIGKMGVPDHILLKPDKLTDEEWVAMRKHPTFAFELLSPVAYLRPALDIPYCHHEKWDGSGYPRGLKGEQIPLTARLFAIVDVWDALRSERPYRKAWPEDKVLEHIHSLVGTHFDPKAVEVFLNMINEDEKNAG